MTALLWDRPSYKPKAKESSLKGKPVIQKDDEIQGQRCEWEATHSCQSITGPN